MDTTSLKEQVAAGISYGPDAESCLKGFGKWEHRDACGALLDSGEFTNVMTSAGMAVRSSLLYGTGTAFTYMAVGTSATTPVAGDTALGGEISTNGLARAAATTSQVTTTSTNDTSQWAKTWTATGASTVQEVGIFNAAAAGTLMCHALIGPITTSNGSQLTVTYKVAHT